MTKNLKIIQLRIFLQGVCIVEALGSPTHNMQAKTFFIGVKSYAWGCLGEKKKTAYPTNDARVIYKLGQDILSRSWDGSGLYQIQVTALDPGSGNTQKDFFQGDETKSNALLKAMDKINQKYGDYTVSPAQLLNKTTMNDVIAPSMEA